MAMESIKDALKTFIIELSEQSDIQHDTKLIDTGVIDSVNFIELIVFIENKYNIKYKNFGFQVSDFETIDTLEHFILKEQGAEINPN